MQAERKRHLPILRAAALLLLLSLLAAALCAAAAAADDEAALPYTDVKSGSWYYDSVDELYWAGIMTGTSKTSFSPDGTVTRGMAVTVLWRLAGCPGADPSAFTDVSPNAYYYDAINWAYAVGITNGTSASTFSPKAQLTRQQLATILYRYVSWQGLDDGLRNGLTYFTDYSSVGKSYQTGMRWAVAHAVIRGTNSDRLSPRGTCTRAELAVMLCRTIHLQTATFTLNHHCAVLTVGQKERITVQTATADCSLAYNSDDTSVATVSARGNITARATGTAVITVTDVNDPDGSARTFTVRVVDPATSVAFVPLDDRPVNTDRAVALAASMGYSLILPAEEDYATELGKAAGTWDAWGDPEELAYFLKQAQAAGISTYIIFTDQLFSGGLLSSRVITDEISDTAVSTARSALSAILADSGNLVYLIDSVERLACSEGYFGYDTKTYSATRAYGSRTRPAVDLSGMTAENYRSYLTDVFETYTDCSADLADCGMSQGTYLSIRRRNLLLTLDTLEQVRDAAAEVVCYIGIDDSSRNAENIQASEIAYLQQLPALFGMDESHFQIKFGIDELCLTCVARFAEQLDARAGSPALTMTVRRFGDLSGETDAYSSISADEMLEEALSGLRLRAAEPEETADLELLLYTDGGDLDEAGALYTANMAAGIRTIVVDFSSGHALGVWIWEQHDSDAAGLRYLLSYSNWGTNANRLGIALSEGLVHALTLRNGSPSDAAAEAWASSLVYDFVIDITYCTELRKKLDLTALSEAVQSFTGVWFGDHEILGAALLDAYLPWDRAFEVRIVPGLTVARLERTAADPEATS